MSLYVLRPPSTEAEIQQELKKLDEAADRIARTPAKARAFLIKHGFITKEGRLTKRYGG